MTIDDMTALPAVRDSRLVWTLAIQYFPGIDDARLPQRIGNVVSWVRAWSHAYDCGPLRQAVVVAYLNPAPCDDRDPWQSSHALVRLQLEDGRLYALQLRGNTQLGLTRLQRLGQALAQRNPATNDDNAAGPTLSALANEDDPGPSRCTVHVVPSASIAMAPKWRPMMLHKVTLGGLNTVRNAYGLRPLIRLPVLLVEHVAWLEAQVDAVVRTFRQRIDQPAVRLIDELAARHHRRHDDLQTYNFLIDIDPMVRRNRIQAVRELPWLLQLLVETDARPTRHAGMVANARPATPLLHAAVASIRSAIDRGRPLFDAVASAFGVPRETVRWTRGRMLPSVTHHGERRTDLLLTLLAWLPPEKRPATDDEWGHWHEMIPPLLLMMSVGLERSALPGALRSNPRYGRVMRRWVRELLRPDWPAAITRLTRMRQQFQDASSIKDYLGSLLSSMDRFHVDAAGHANAAGDHLDTLLDWLSSTSLAHVARRAVEWHAVLDAELQRAPRRLAPVGQGAIRWPLVLPSPLSIGRFTVVELADAVSLAEEGLAMHHCVGGYAGHCLHGDRMIVSIRSSGGTRRSTVELSIDTTSLHVAVCQHKAAANEPPSPDCQATADRLVGILNGSAYRDGLSQRAEFQRIQKRRALTMSSIRQAEVDGYRQIAEDAAWRVTFGAPPSEKRAALRRQRTSREANASSTRA